MKEIEIGDGGFHLPGLLAHPQGAAGLVIFAHGGGSSRHSPRNRQVAERLNRHGIATLLFDLLTQEEAARREKVFDIGLLAARLLCATDWVRGQTGLAGLRLGYFGASTGAAAALAAASERGGDIAAVVSRGGRPDLAFDLLKTVTAPTLLLVGEFDYDVLELNRRAAAFLPRCELVVIPGATHLFEEPGTLTLACREAEDWFNRYLCGEAPQR